MNKMKIRLKNIDECQDFVSICNTFKSDINIYERSNVLDAKSIIGIFSISLGSIVEVQMISSDENEIVSFMRAIKKFRVA